MGDEGNYHLYFTGEEMEDPLPEEWEKGAGHCCLGAFPTLSPSHFIVLFSPGL